MVTVKFGQLKKRPNSTSNSYFEFDIFGPIPNYFEPNSKFRPGLLAKPHGVNPTYKLNKVFEQIPNVALSIRNVALGLNNNKGVRKNSV